MKRYLICLSVLSCLAVSGCVTTGTYEMKEQEAQKLEQGLQEQRGTNQLLKADIEQLKNDLAQARREIAAVSGEKALLAEDKRGLEEALKSTADQKNQKIGDLSRKLGEQEAEGRRLKDEVARLQRLKDEEVQNTSRTYAELLDQMKGEIAKGEVTISELKGKLTVNVVDSVLFDSGKAEVKQDGLAVLKKVVDILKGVSGKVVRIEGHTDNVQIGEVLARRYPTNWELSAARAINVTRYLQQQGLDPALLSAAAFGEYKPVAPNDSEQGRAKNRRIEIVLVARE